jgi:hypothetical protein
MICAIFGMQVDTVEEAVEQDWIPYSYDNQIEGGPACPNCSEALLDMDEN